MKARLDTTIHAWALIVSLGGLSLTFLFAELAWSSSPFFEFGVGVGLALIYGGIAIAQYYPMRSWWSDE